MMKFNDALKAVKENEELKVVTEGKTYFTVENEEGFRAYCQADLYGGDVENTDYYRGYQFSTTHKPNRKTGTGYQTMNDIALETEEDLFICLDRTLEESKRKVTSGKEKKDTRQPKNGFLGY